MVTSLNIVVILVSAILIIFSRLCVLQKTEEISNNSIINSVVFPKDRPKSPSLRIIEGMDAIPNSYPFQVAIVVFGSKVAICGGTLITPEWVLTAAHCLEGDDISHALLVLGAHDLSAPEPTKVELVLPPDAFVFHEDWDSPNLHNDIGMIHLTTNVTLTPYIQTINYADDDDERYEDEVATIIGWGETEISGASTTLKEVSEPVISNEECAERLKKYKIEIISSQLCTTQGGITGSSCKGDSGGPLLDNTGVQIGIISFGPKNCGTPSVYTRVSHFADWIYRVTHGLPTGARHASGCCIFPSLRGMAVISTIVYLLTYFA